MAGGTDRRTRLAPSPTGGLHLGNARTFALTWALARNEGWSVVLRIEDLDRDRVKPGANEATVEILAWLGLDHDEPVTTQSADLTPFREAMARLARDGALFRCDRSRADVRRAASAPHAEDGELRYDPSLRPPRGEAWSFRDPNANHRLRVDPGQETVHDELSGDHRFDPGLAVGDFLVWTKLGVPSYQLAVVVDDIRQGVTDVVRGDDLLPSAARQQLLYRHLAAAPPRWWHLPLVHDEAGERLAKRHDAQSLAALRDRGVRAERVLGLLAAWCGFLPAPEPITREDFRRFVGRDTLQALVRRERSQPCRALKEQLEWLES